MSELTEITFHTPIGWIRMFASLRGVSSLTILSTQSSEPFGESFQPLHPLLQQAKAALDRYFESGAELPEIALDINGTEFQKSVWREIQKLGVGETLTYGEIAANIGRPAAVRAVGAAVGANPVPILIGCHRVLGSGQRITGYSGGDGLPTKRQLLALENIEYRE